MNRHTAHIEKDIEAIGVISRIIALNTPEADLAGGRILVLAPQDWKDAVCEYCGAEPGMAIETIHNLPVVTKADLAEPAIVTPKGKIYKVRQEAEPEAQTMPASLRALSDSVQQALETASPEARAQMESSIEAASGMPATTH